MRKICLLSTLLLLSLVVSGPVCAQSRKGKAAKTAKTVKKSASPITIGTIIYKVSDLENQFQMLKNAGFTSCQLNWNAQVMTPEFAPRVKAAEEKYGLKVTTVVGVPGSGTWDFKKGPSTIGLVPIDGRQAKIDMYHRMIDFCQAAGVPAMHSHFGFIPEDMSSDRYKDFIFVMKPLAAYAKERGIDIYFETGQETPITLVRAIKDIDSDNLYINCDVGNLLLYGKANPTDAIRLFGPLVKDIHAKDGKLPTRENPYVLGAEKPIPEGDVDFPAIIKLLKAEGYTGAITIECELSGSTEEYLTKTRKYLQDLIDNE